MKKFTNYLGLPAKVEFCKKCVVSNQRPNSEIEFKNIEDKKKSTIFFDEEGVCSACRFAEIKDKIDWNKKCGPVFGKSSRGLVPKSSPKKLPIDLDYECKSRGF